MERCRRKEDTQNRQRPKDKEEPEFQLTTEERTQEALEEDQETASRIKEV